MAAVSFILRSSSANSYVGAESRRFVTRLFGGKLSPLIAQMAEEEALDDADVAEIEALLREFQVMIAWLAWNPSRDQRADGARPAHSRSRSPDIRRDRGLCLVAAAGCAGGASVFHRDR